MVNGVVRALINKHFYFLSLLFIDSLCFFSQQLVTQGNTYSVHIFIVSVWVCVCVPVRIISTVIGDFVNDRDNIDQSGSCIDSSDKAGQRIMLPQPSLKTGKSRRSDENQIPGGGFPLL